MTCFNPARYFMSTYSAGGIVGILIAGIATRLPENLSGYD